MNSQTKPELSTTLKIAIKAAKSAATVIQDFAVKAVESNVKVVSGTEMGLVTQADLMAEKEIVSLIHSVFPDHKILSEEGFSDLITAEHLWIIDPLDGTNNFAHGIPHYSVSIAYCHLGVIQCGVVVNAATNELFYAEQGRGAFVDNRIATVSDEQQLTEAMIATGFYYDRDKMMKETLDTINDLFRNNIRGIRRFGSAALDLCYVGCGRYSAFFEYTLFPWDFAAGYLFVQEAGGCASDCFGQPIQIRPTSMLASNQQLHTPMLDVISRHYTAE